MERRILGFSDEETVMLDFDRITFVNVKKYAFRVMKHFHLGGFMVLNSSKDSYHIVFNRRVDWGLNVEIMAWVCFISKHKPLTKWFIMQCIKHGSTLRIGPKRKKGPPKIVFVFGQRNRQIKTFLKYKNDGFVKKCLFT